MTVYEAREWYIGCRIVLFVFPVWLVIRFSMLCHETGRIIWMVPQAILEALFYIFALKIIRSLTSYTRRQLAIARALDQNGINQQGVIVDKWCEEYGDGATRCFLGYRFSDMGDTWVGKHHVNSSAIYKRTQIGDRVTVRFLRYNPAISRLPDLETDFT